MSTAPTVPCPPWCARPEGHDLTRSARGRDGTWRRVHFSVDVPDGHGHATRVEQLEVAGRDGSLWREPEQVRCWHVDTQLLVAGRPA